MKKRTVRARLRAAFGRLTPTQARRLVAHLDAGHGVACGPYAYEWVDPHGYG